MESARAAVKKSIQPRAMSDLVSFDGDADDEEDAGGQGEVAESLHPGHEVVQVEAGGDRPT